MKLLESLLYLLLGILIGGLLIYIFLFVIAVLMGIVRESLDDPGKSFKVALFLGLSAFIGYMFMRLTGITP